MTENATNKGTAIELGGPGPGGAVARQGDPTEVSVPSGPVDMARIVSLAERGVDPDTIGKMVDLYERVHNIQAKQAFNEAMLAIQKHMDTTRVPATGRNKVTKNGTTVPYHTLTDIQRVLNPVCAGHGISYGFDTETASKAFVLTLNIRHTMGHAEKVRTTVPLDESGSKNAIQGVGSSESYGMRYGLIKGFGLSRYLHDNDGADGGPAEDDDVETVTEEQAANLQALWDEVGSRINPTDFYAYFGVPSKSLADMPAARCTEALDMLQRKRK